MIIEEKITDTNYRTTYKELRTRVLDYGFEVCTEGKYKEESREEYDYMVCYHDEKAVILVANEYEGLINKCSALCLFKTNLAEEEHELQMKYQLVFNTIHKEDRVFSLEMDGRNNLFSKLSITDDYRYFPVTNYVHYDFHPYECITSNTEGYDERDKSIWEDCKGLPSEIYQVLSTQKEYSEDLLRQRQEFVRGLKQGTNIKPSGIKNLISKIFGD